MFENLEAEKRNTKNLIIKTKDKVVKIPFTLSGWKEIRQERVLIKEVQKDSCFSPHLLKYKYIFGCSVTARLLSLEEVREKEKLVEEYFQKAFENADQWGEKPLRYLLDADFFLDFISKNVPSSYHCLAKYLDSIELPQSSAHSDFHQKNILVKGNELYFVDWSRYKSDSSRYFDLLDFYTYSKGEKSEPWMQVWSRQYNYIPETILGIKLPREYFLAYAIWRASEELKELAIKKCLNKYKRKKYIGFINILAEKISTA